MKRKINILLLFFLLVGGGYFLYQGLKIEIKSQIAQIFLKQAWEKSLITKKNIKPWSKMDSYPIFKLDVPKLNVEHIILNKTSSQALSFAPGFHQESYLPYQGKTTIISMHRDSHGSFLKNLMVGDIIKLQDIKDEWHSYAVNNFYILDVKNNNFSMTDKKNILLLVTCYPFDAIQSGTPYRYIVSAQKI